MHPEEKLITQAIKSAQIYFEKTLDNPTAIVAAIDNLTADVQGEGIANADIVIESIFENMEMKQELLQRIETQIKPSAFIATNTSSLLLEDLGKPLQDRSRLVGMHFFNPVTEMQLVELVKGQHTSQKILEKSFAFIGQLSKLPLQVKSSPGFLLNRCFVPYIVAAVNLLDEGVNCLQEGIISDKDMFDAGMLFGFLFPPFRGGPIHYAEQVGIAADVLNQLQEQRTKGL